MDRQWRAPLSSMLEYWRCWSCASSHSCCNFITATTLLVQKANSVFGNHSWPLAFTFLRYYLHSSEIFPEPWRQIYTRDDSFSTHQHISRSVSSCASCAIFLRHCKPLFTIFVTKWTTQPGGSDCEECSKQKYIAWTLSLSIEQNILHAILVVNKLTWKINILTLVSILVSLLHTE